MALTEEPRAEADRAPLEELPILALLDDDVRRLVIESFVPLQFAFGDAIVREGDAADAFFVLASGTARVLKERADGDELTLNLLHTGDSFGESALFEGTTRTATVRASDQVTIFRLDRGVFSALIKLYPDVRDAFAQQSRARALRDLLRIHPAFGALPPRAAGELLPVLEPLELAAGEQLFAAGSPPDATFLVEDGRLRAWVSEDEGHVQRNVHFFRTGDFVGEDSLLQEVPRAATVDAVSATTLLRMDTATFRALLDAYPDVRARFADRVAAYDYERRANIPLDFADELLPAEVRSERRESAAARDAGLHGMDVDVVAAATPAAADHEGHSTRRPPRRFPHVHQLDEMDCGAASVAMLCRYFGHPVSLPHIREAVGTSTDGTSLRGIKRGGEAVGLDIRAVKASKDRLDELDLPAVCHVGGNHWVVVYGLKGDRVLIADPATGLRKKPRTEFLADWSGYAATARATPRLRDAPVARSSARWLLPFIRPMRRRLGVAFGLAVTAAALQMLLPVMTKIVIDDVVSDRDYSLLHLITLGMLGVLVLAVGATLVQRRLLARMAVVVDTASADFLTEKLLALPMSYFNARRSGDIERRLNGMRQVRRFFVENGVRALTAVTQLVAALVIMFVFSWPLALGFLAVIPIYAALMRFSSRRLGPVFETLEEAYGRHQSRQIDAIKGIETVKSMGAEPRLRSVMARDLRALSEKIFRADYTLMVYDGLVQTVSFVVVLVFLWVAALQVLAGNMTVGELVSFNSLVLLANAPILTLLAIWDDGQLARVMLGRLQDIFEQEPEQGSVRDGLREVATLEGRVTLSGLGFRYPTSPESPILSGVTLDVAPGTRVALVGRSGSGKSTLVKCLAGLLEPTDGSISYDGIDMRELDYGSLRRRIGFVLQEPYLFDDTIAANIALGDPAPDMQRIEWAAEVANAQAFVERLPLAYETRVGESGLRLSGGQAQRISIARAVYHQPPVLIFDEATSALDTESERLVKANMDRLLQGRTSFVIAHRLSTIRDADLILVLEQGRVVEKGSHEELMRLQGLYYYLHSQQLSAS